MITYKVEIVLKLDDDGYLFDNCWILDSIDDQLGDGEEIIKYKVSEVKKPTKENI